MSVTTSEGLPGEGGGGACSFVPCHFLGKTRCHSRKYKRESPTEIKPSCFSDPELTHLSRLVVSLDTTAS